jgi:hypothetical protein
LVFYVSDFGKKRETGFGDGELQAYIFGKAAEIEHPLCNKALVRASGTASLNRLISSVQQFSLCLDIKISLNVESHAAAELSLMVQVQVARFSNFGLLFR